MNYSLISIKPRGAFLTVKDTEERPRYICFTHKLDAAHCISYISRFRSKYGYFPIFDMSKPQEKHEIIEQIKHREPSEISNFFSIKTLDDIELDRLCSITNANFFCVHSFSYQCTKDNDMRIMLSAQNLDSVPNLYKYTNNLNKYY